MSTELQEPAQPDRQVYEGVALVLRQAVGLGAPDLKNPLHKSLFDAVVDLGPHASLGMRIVALRYVFNWELVSAGSEYATAKANYEKYMSRAKAALLSEPKMSVAKAEVIADSDDEAYRLKLQYLVAEQRERAMRKFLDTLDAALENHRTDRADQRAGDRAHAGGYTGGA